MKAKEITSSFLKQVYPKRKAWDRKGNYGKVLVIGGSKLYHGSPTFNALAAYRAGVDLVFVASVERAANLIASFSPDLIVYPLKGDYFSISHIDEIFETFPNFDALVIGGGMTRRKEVIEFIQEFLKRIKVPSVIDADAIYAISENLDLIKRKPFVITSHSYEFFVLTKQKVTENLEERISLVKEFALKYQTTILLKGYIDVISDGNEVFINKTGNPYMTVGGTGDTLAGIVGTFLARKISPLISACAGAWLNGKAGEYASEKLKESFLASDLIREIPRVIKENLNY